MEGVAPHMCDQVARPLLDQGAGGRSPGFLLRAKQTLARSWVKLDHPSSALRPASVILIRPTAIALPVSLCAVASPVRTSLASIGRVKPWTCMIASVAPNGLQASNRSARLCSPPRRGFRGLTVIVCDIVGNAGKAPAG